MCMSLDHGRRLEYMQTLGRYFDCSTYAPIRQNMDCARADVKTRKFSIELVPGRESEWDFWMCFGWLENQLYG